MNLEFNRNEDKMKQLLNQMNQKLEKIYLGGGKNNIAKQHEKNKLTARERIAYLIDEGSRTVEIGAFAGDDKFPTSTDVAILHGSDQLFSGLINSLYIGLGTASIVVLAGALMSYTARRGQVLGRKVFEAVGTIPLGVPGLLLSLGLLLAYLGTPLYNTAAGILVALVIFYLPYGLRITSSTQLRIHKEMDEAATVHGASWRFVFTKITLPLLRPALASAFFYVFIASYREVGAAVLLTGPGLNYGAVTIFDYYRLGQWAEAAAGSVIYAILLFTFILLAMHMFKISLTQ